MSFTLGSGGGFTLGSGGGFTLGGSGGFGVPGGGVPKKGRGILGDIVHVADVATQPIENLAKDVGEAAVQFPLGLYAIGKTAATHPEDLGKYVTGIVKQYEDYYGHDILQHLWDHPLQPILDGLTVASLGLTAGASAPVVGALRGAGFAGTAAKLGELGERGTLVTRSPLAMKTGEGPTVERLTSNKPIVKLRQQTVHKMTRALDDFARAKSATGYFGPLGKFEEKAYGRATSDKAIRKALQEATPMRGYEKAWGKLSKEERIALSARSMDIDPVNLKRYWEGTKNGDELTDEVADLMRNPSEKMATAELHARELSQQGAELLKKRGALSIESELDRPGRFKDQVAAALGHPVDSLHDNPYYLPHTTSSTWQRGSHPMQQVGGGKAEVKRLGSTKENLGELFAEGKLDLANDVLGPEFLRRVKWLKFWGIHEGLKRGAVRMTWDELHAAHKSGQPPPGWDFLRTSTPTRKSDALRVQVQKAEERNRRFPNFDNAEKLRKLKIELSRYESGRRPDPVSYGKQKVPFSVRGEREEGPGMYYESQDIPNPEDLQDSVLVNEGWTTKELAHAYTDEAGHYYLVPKHMARAATGEFTRMSDFMYQWARRPLRIWRAALLGLRPAFFVNNLIGNSLMYAMKTGGTGAARDLFMALRESHPDRVMKQLLADAVVPDDVRASLAAEFFPGEEIPVAKGKALAVRERPAGAALTEAPPREPPPLVTGETPTVERPDFYTEQYPEHISGTFGKTQSPSTEGLLRGATGRAGRAWETTTGWLPEKTSLIAEEKFRRGLIRNFIRRSPEFKAVYSSMPKETRNFIAAARKLHAGEGGEKFQRMISQQVDHALGNYTRLSPVERNALRNVFPFYAWYRAILSTSMYLAIDNPARAQILVQLGRIGAETAANHAGILGGVPSYLQGALPLGAGPGGTKRVLATQSINPWATLNQLSRGARADITSLGMNPFIIGAMETFKDLASAPGGTTRAVSAQDLIGTMLSTIVQGLPPLAQLHPRGPSNLYPNRGPLTAWEAWAGAPIKEYNPFVAGTYWAAGQ